ncbi:MAG: 30S ribosomal protein S16 [Phycisphaerae bacterium]|nr:30S ribosomal protein S16 [Phycisphaerae bacterium]
MVVLRLKRMGRIHRPFYRLGAMDKRSPRDGRVIEELGWFDPVAKDNQINFNTDRVKYWLNAGAQPSETVANLLKKAGIDPMVGKGKGVRKVLPNAKPKPAAPKAAAEAKA